MRTFMWTYENFSVEYATFPLKQITFFSTHVCKVTFKYLPKPLKSHKLQDPRILFENPPLYLAKYNIERGGGGSCEILEFKP